MKRNSSTGERLKGVYLRGKKFWYRHSYEGRQYRAPPDTENEADALNKAMRMRANPPDHRAEARRSQGPNFGEAIARALKL